MFKSDIFDSPQALEAAKDDAWRGVEDKRERNSIVRKFTNMMNTYTAEEAKQLGITEITNHGLTYRDMLQNEMQYTSMVTVTNALVEVIVDTDNPEKDSEVGMRISEAINRGAIHFKGRFGNFWRKVAGEIVIAGGCPVTQNSRYGWLPQVCPDMFFPPASSLDAEQIPYAFDPKELTIDDLEKLRKSVKGEDSKLIDVKNVDALLKKVRENIKNNSKDGGSSFVEEVSGSVRSNKKAGANNTIPAWWFYEVKYDDSGNQFVSATLWVGANAGLNLPLEKGEDGSVKVIAYIDKAFESATDWLHMAAVDSEIGGVKNMDTLRGIAEMSYASGLEMEELMNLLMEGDKIRARPKIRLTNEADADAVAKWNILQDLYAPAGVEEMQFKGDSRGLLTPFNMLAQNAAGMAAGSVSNNSQGGELRQQAVERQRNSSALQANRVSEAYNHMESILETVVHRLLAGKTKPGTDGYHEIMWIRDRLDTYGIPYKKLAERKHGRFQYLRVRARRSIGNGDRNQQIETADWMISQLPSIPPESRPLVLKRAFELHTQDPDLTEQIIKVPQAIINAQKVTAENEGDTIKRRAPLGQILPVAVDDIHQDHIPVHLLDMQAMVATHAVRPWDKLDVIAFAGMVEHTGEHIKILLANPATNPEAKLYIQDYQNIVASAQAIIKEVEESDQKGSAEAQLTPKEQADFQLKMEGLRQSGIKLGITTEENRALYADREARRSLASRAQYTKEINDDRRLKIEQERIEVQRQQKKNNNKKTK